MAATREGVPHRNALVVDPVPLVERVTRNIREHGPFTALR